MKGSRSCPIEISSLIAVLIFRPTAVNQFARNLLIVVVLLFLAVRLPIFNEGVKVLSDRDLFFDRGADLSADCGEPVRAKFAHRRGAPFPRGAASHLQ